MSADIYEKDIQAAKDSGMDSFIEKPLNKDEVKQKILNLTGTGAKDTGLKVHASIKNKGSEWTGIATEHNSLELKRKAYDHLSKNFNDEVVAKLLQTATESIEKYINNIKQNVIEQDMKELLEDFHAIKGLLINLGLKEEAKTASELQDNCILGNLQKVRSIKQIFLKNMTSFLNELQKDGK